MLTLAQAFRRRGSAGEPLPDIYQSLAARGARPIKGGLTLVIGPASAGKSLLMFNLLVGYAQHNLPSLAFLLDTNELDGASRFASILTGDPFVAIKERVLDGDDYFIRRVMTDLPDLHAVFYAPELSDVEKQLKAFDQRYGAPPDVLVLDNLGNQTSGLDNEYAMLKALTLELDHIAKVEQTAVIAAHHTTDLTDMEPAARDKMLGKLHHYAALILSVNFNPDTREYKVAVVKTREGPSDLAAKHPVVMWADPGRMKLTEHPQVAHAWKQPEIRPLTPSEYAEHLSRVRHPELAAAQAGAPSAFAGTAFGGIR